MHSMLAEQIDTEFLSRFRKAEQAVESDNVGKDSTTLVIVNHVQKLQCHVTTRTIEQLAVFSFGIEIVYTLVLMMQDIVEYNPPRAFILEHASHKLLEIDVAVIQLVRNWSL